MAEAGADGATGSAAAVANARRVNPEITVIQLSARTGEGLETWYGWLRREAVKARAETFA